MSPQKLISVLVIFSSFLFACKAVPSSVLERKVRSVKDPVNPVKPRIASGQTKKVTITDDRIEVVVAGGHRANASQIWEELKTLRQTTKALDKRLQALEQNPNDFSLLFPKKSVTDYVLIRGMTALQAVTVCFWMRSSDKTDGTPFSYQSSYHEELTLYNYNSFTPNVGGQWLKTSSVSANDGIWHHICFSWENTAGSWSIYKDGSQKAKGAGFKKGYTTRAGGILMLGQEQDSLGGRLDAKQSFVGEMADVNVWNRVLSAQQISKLSKSCFAGEGNVLKWSDFKSAVVGAVRVVESSSCKS